MNKAVSPYFRWKDTNSTDMGVYMTSRPTRSVAVLNGQKANMGKGDKEIFEALVKDKGYFMSHNPPTPLQPPVQPMDSLSPKTREEFLKMSFNDQLRFKEQNETAYRQLVGLPAQNE